MKLTPEEARSLVSRIGPKLGYDHTYEPVFPEGRDDVCVVRHLAEDGSTYGFDTIYLVWKKADGTVGYRKIKDSRLTKDYIHIIDPVEVNEDGSISVTLYSGGSYSGVRWSETIRVTISDQVEVLKEKPVSFKEEVKQAMLWVVEHRVQENPLRHHPLYKPTMVKESVINEERGIAVWILFEHIDTDRFSEYDEGTLGDQFRYSLWVMKAGGIPWRIYEDHAYIRPWTKNPVTGTRGRDCSLKNLRLEGNVIRVMHLKGERVEEQEPEELSFKL